MIDLLPVERLANAPIALAVVQLRFPPLFDFDDRPRFARFVEQIAQDYPIYSDERTHTFLVSDKAVESSGQGEHQRRFTNAEATWSVVLGPEQLLLECRRAYRDIDDMVSRFVPLANALRGLGVTQQVRFGFRYVNELRQGSDYVYWRTHLNPQYLGFDAAADLGGTVVSTIAEVNLQRTDGFFRMRRGFLPAGTVVPPLPQRSQGPPQGPFYLIDLDYFDERVGPINADFQQTLRTYNLYMFNVFRTLIGPGELWNQLRGEP